MEPHFWSSGASSSFRCWHDAIEHPREFHLPDAENRVHRSLLDHSLPGFGHGNLDSREYRARWLGFFCGDSGSQRRENQPGGEPRKNILDRRTWIPPEVAGSHGIDCLSCLRDACSRLGLDSSFLGCQLTCFNRMVKGESVRDLVESRAGVSWMVGL